MSAIHKIVGDDIEQAHCEECDCILVQISGTEVICPRCARAELAALREADIRTMEMCSDCGAMMVIDYDAPEGETENQMYCPVCLCKGLEQVNGALRAQAAMLDDYAETIRMHEITIVALEAAAAGDVGALYGIAAGFRDASLDSAASVLEAYVNGMAQRAAHPAQQEQKVGSLSA